MLWLLWQREGGRCRLAHRFRLHLHISLSESQGSVVAFEAEAANQALPPPGHVHRISSCASLSRHGAFQHPSYCLLKGIQSIILLFVMNDKPERREACRNVSRRSCLSEVLKSGSSLPNWTRHTHLVPTNETTFFFLQFLSRESYPDILISDPIFPICSHISPHTPTMSSTSCLWSSEGWHISHEALTLKHGH